MTQEEEFRRKITPEDVERARGLAKRRDADMYRYSKGGFLNPNPNADMDRMMDAIDKSTKAEDLAKRMQEKPGRQTEPT